MRKWCFWPVVLEKTLESSLDSREVKLVNPKGNQSWIFIGRTDAEAEALILWPPDVKSQFIGKNPDAGKGWGQEEKGGTEDEMIGWHTDSMDMSLSKLREGVKDREAWRAAVHGISDWTTTTQNWSTFFVALEEKTYKWLSSSLKMCIYYIRIYVCMSAC